METIDGLAFIINTFWHDTLSLLDTSAHYADAIRAMPSDKTQLAHLLVLSIGGI